MIIYCWNKSQEEKNTCLKKIYPHDHFLSSSLHSSLFHYVCTDLCMTDLKVCSSVQPCLLQSTQYYLSYNIFIEHFPHKLPPAHPAAAQGACWPDGRWSPYSVSWVAPRVCSQVVEAGMPSRGCLRGNFNISLNCINQGTSQSWAPHPITESEANQPAEAAHCCCL